MVLASADTAVWLDLPLWTCLQRIVARTFRRARSREPLFGTDTRESWRHQLGRDSLIWWVLTTHRRRRREYAARFADPAYAHLHVVRLQSTGAVASWLQRFDPIAVGSASVESSEIERRAE
jgi:hypothetical protein